MDIIDRLDIDRNIYVQSRIIATTSDQEDDDVTFILWVTKVHIVTKDVDELAYARLNALFVMIIELTVVQEHDFQISIYTIGCHKKIHVPSISRRYLIN